MVRSMDMLVVKGCVHEEQIPGMTFDQFDGGMMRLSALAMADWGDLASLVI